jgi:GAF domain-containing protein
VRTRLPRAPRLRLRRSGSPDERILRYGPSVGGTETGDEGLLEVFADIARQLQAETTAALTLGRIVRAAVDIVKGCDHAGIFVVDRHGSLDSSVASDGASEALDAIQRESGEGPCLETLQEHQSYLVDDLLTEPRWPRFSRRAAEATGVRSMMSLSVFVQDETIGALNLYSRRPEAFDEHDLAVSAILVAHGAVAIAHARERERAQNLEKAVESNREIGIAIGILMARGPRTRAHAFQQLRSASQHLHTKLRDIAATVVETGELPDGAR